MLDLKKKYPTMTTEAFARMTRQSVGQARYWARSHRLQKNPDFLRETKRENARLQWARRVPCATDHDGLSHAVAISTNVFSPIPNGESLRMRCGARFVPRAAREKDFPACVKCVALIAAAREKPKMPPVEASGLKRKNRKDKCKNR